MGRSGAFALTLIVLAGWMLLLPPQIQAEDREFNLWPLVYSRQSEDGGSSELEFLWPFVTGKREGDKREWGVHPLFSVSDDGEGTHEVQVLWPLVRYRKREQSYNLRVLPLLIDRQATNYQGGVTRRFYFFPLFSGVTPAGGQYAGLFPCVGRITGVFGHDEIFFVMFPLYASWRGGEHRGYATPWPLAGWSSGGRVDSLKILPFYARRETRPDVRVVSFLWPIFSRFGSDDGSVSGFLFFPFYGELRTRQGTSRICPFPVLIRTSDDYQEYNVPWPIVKIARGDDLAQLQVWPLFGSRRCSWRDDYFFIWPILTRRIERGEDWEKRFLWIMPFLIRRVNKQGARESSRNVFWPLAKWRSSPEESETTMLSPLWFEDAERGIERNYAMFWTVFRSRGGEQRREWRVLGRLITRKEGADHEELEVVHLFRYERKGSEKKIRLLKGALGYERDDDGRKLRVLWFLKIPLGEGR